MRNEDIKNVLTHFPKWFPAILCGLFISACNPNEKSRTYASINKGPLDTISISEDMAHLHVDLKFDTLDSENKIPRNIWVKVEADATDTLKDILENARLSLNSKDSNFIIKKWGFNKFSFFINSAYKTEYSQNNGMLEIYPSLSPDRGIVLNAYWLDQPISYPEGTIFQQRCYPLANN